MGGIARFPEHADEASPWELSGQVGHQLNFRPLAVFDANHAEVSRVCRRPKLPKHIGEDGVKIAKNTPMSEGGVMAYYKVLIEVWCDWDPRKSDLKEIAGHVALREGAICTLQEVIRMVDRPQEIENDAAMSFFGGEEGDADLSQG